MKTTFLFTAIFIATQVLGQNPYPSTAYNFSLFQNQVRQININQGDELKEVWRVNAEQHTIEVLKLHHKSYFAGYSLDLSQLENVDDKYFAHTKTVFYYSENGHIDSSKTTRFLVVFPEQRPVDKNWPAEIHTKNFAQYFTYDNNCIKQIKYTSSVQPGVDNFTYFTCKDGRISKSVAYGGQLLKNYHYNDAGLLVKIDSPNGYQTLYEYDAEGRLTKSGTGDRHKEITYYENGLKKSETRPDGEPMAYQYNYIFIN